MKGSIVLQAKQRAKPLDLENLFANIYMGDDSGGERAAVTSPPSAAAPGHAASPAIAPLAETPAVQRLAGKASHAPPRPPRSTASNSSFKAAPASAPENALKRATDAGPGAPAASPAQPKIVSLTARNLHLKEKVEKVSKRAASRPESVVMHTADDEELRALEGAPTPPRPVFLRALAARRVCACGRASCVV